MAHGPQFSDPWCNGTQIRDRGLWILRVKKQVGKDKVMTAFQKITHSSVRKIPPRPATV